MGSTKADDSSDEELSKRPAAEAHTSVAESENFDEAASPPNQLLAASDSGKQDRKGENGTESTLENVFV